MQIMNPKVRQDMTPYIIQCGLATLTMLIVLLFLDVLFHAAIIVSLGSTAFTIFAMPKSRAARTRPLIGGYLIAIALGVLCSFLSLLPKLFFTPASERPLLIFFGALAVGLAIFVMILADCEHPPAAGMALGLVLNSWDRETLTFVLSAVLLLAIVKRLLKSTLVDLV